MTKIRVVENRRGIHVHGFHCAEHGTGEETVVEASSAIEVVEDLALDLAQALFYPCVAFGGARVGATPRISRRDTLDVKADTISTWAEENDWEVEDLGQTILLTRQHSETTETIRLMFKGNSYDRAGSQYAHANDIASLPDLDTVMLRIASAPGVVLGAEQRRRKPLPFSPKGSTDVDVLDAVRGRTVYWLNGITGATEVGLVRALEKMNDGTRVGNHVKIDTTSTGRRVLTFPDGNGTGFRSVGLDSIMEVSG